MNCQLILSLIRSWAVACVWEGQFCAHHPCHRVQDFLRGCHYGAGTTMLCNRVPIPLPMLPPRSVSFLKKFQIWDVTSTPDVATDLVILGIIPEHILLENLALGFHEEMGRKKRNALFFKHLKKKKSLCIECFLQPGYQGHSVKKTVLELIFSLCCNTSPWHQYQ